MKGLVMMPMTIAREDTLPGVRHPRRLEAEVDHILMIGLAMVDAMETIETEVTTRLVLQWQCRRLQLMTNASTIIIPTGEIDEFLEIEDDY